MRRVFLFVVFVLFLAVQISWGQIPETISYQGVLTDAGGSIVPDDNYSLSFDLYEVSSGGTSLWTETHGSVVVASGVFNVVLGLNNPLSIAFDRPYWLAVRVGTGPELTPRIRLTSSPYSLNTRWIEEGVVWYLTGNAGIDPVSNFLGTVDDQPLELRVNSLRSLLLQPHAVSPNLIGGYNGNKATSEVYGAVISGGGESGSQENYVFDNYGAIGGGSGNQAGNDDSIADNAPYATVGGGYMNRAIGQFSTVAGGDNNEASGEGATVAGGVGNSAQGQFSFAAGHRAKAVYNGCFVWGDSTDDDIHANGPNRFMVRAAGGTRFYSNASRTAGVSLPAGGSAWMSVSDKALKRNIRPVDGRDILARLAGIPISQWSYKSQDPGIEHIGPMAQDFYAAFGLGDDDKHISTIDPDGVALAAIQGLYELVEEKNAVIATQQKEIESQQEKMAELEDRLAALERLCKGK